MFIPPEYSEQELRRRCGSPRQLARISRVRLCEGREEGVEALEFRTGTGFNFTVLPGRGMDIAFADFRGRNLAWLSPVGIVAAPYHEPAGYGWMRSHFGGLLATCGLVNVGAPDTIDGEEYGLNGRISHTPAANVSHDMVWADDDLYLLARGEMRECRPPHVNLVLRRRVKTRASASCLAVHDTLTNEGHTSTPLQLLYQVNTGFPLLGNEAHLVTPSVSVTPRDSDAADDKEHFAAFGGPTPGYREKVYYHELAPATDGRSWAAVLNPALDGGLGLYVKYDPTHLPCLAQWKMMGEGLYAMGLGPANGYGLNYEKQKALGQLRMIEPGQSIDIRLEIGVLSGADALAAFEREVTMVRPPELHFHTQWI